MEQRYRALRTIGSIFRVVGYIILVITILAALASCGFTFLGGSMLSTASQQLGMNSTGAGILGGLFGGLLIGFFVLLYGGMIALVFVAFGEGIYLLIDIESNTRRTAYLVETQKVIPPTTSTILPPD